MTTPPDPPAPDPEAGRIKSIADLQAEQERQGGVLDKILSRLAGAPEPDTSVTSADPAPAAAAADMGAQMRQAIKDVQAEEDAELGRQHRLGKRPEPETSPREVMVRGKDRLQRALFGGDPK